MKLSGVIGCVLAVCGSYAGNLHAQSPKQSISFNWGVMVPADNGFVENTGWVNPSLEWNYRVLPALSAGISLGYGFNSVRGIADERFDGDLISGYREKKLSIVPVMALVNYFPMGNGGALFRPYLGIGAGVQYAKFQITGDNIITSTTANLAEVFSAQLGTRICPGKTDKFYLDTRFSWQYGGNSWPAAEIKSIRGLGFALGAGFTF